MEVACQVGERNRAGTAEGAGMDEGASHEQPPRPVPILFASKNVPAAGLPPSLKGQMSGKKLIIVKGWRL